MSVTCSQVLRLDFVMFPKKENPNVLFTGRVKGEMKRTWSSPPGDKAHFAVPFAFRIIKKEVQKLAFS